MMDKNMKAGSDLHAGDGGYSVGTQEKYDEFVKGRNQSLGNMRIKELKEQAMEWVPNMADPDTKIKLLNAEKFALLIVRECVEHLESSVLVPNIEHSRTKTKCVGAIKEHFGVE
jgi:hypothetical protein